MPSQIKTEIFEIAELYTHRYPELLTSSSSVEAFVRALWSLLGGGQRNGIAYDGLVAQSLRFLSTAVRSGNYRGIFAAKETIASLVEGVVVPNVSLRGELPNPFYMPRSNLLLQSTKLNNSRMIHSNTSALTSLSLRPQHPLAPEGSQRRARRDGRQRRMYYERWYRAVSKRTQRKWC